MAYPDPKFPLSRRLFLGLATAFCAAPALADVGPALVKGSVAKFKLAAAAKPLPDFAFLDAQDRELKLSAWRGKTVLVNFWATWCAPCRREIPMLNDLARDPAHADFALIGIAIDFREDVLRFLAETPIDYPVLIGEQDGLDASAAFGMRSLGLPYTAFVDRTGRIVTIHLGELHRPQAEVILSAVRALDAGEIDLATAQERIRTQVPKIG